MLIYITLHYITLSHPAAAQPSQAEQAAPSPAPVHSLSLSQGWQIDERGMAEGGGGEGGGEEGFCHNHCQGSRGMGAID